MRADELDYHLPAGLIAQHPAPERDKSRLMVVDRSACTIEHAVFSDLHNWFAAGDLLVANDSRVFPARLIGRKAGGCARVEALLLAEKLSGLWETMLRPSGKIKPGGEIIFGEGELRATPIERLGDGTWLCSFATESGIESALEKLGRTPLPPYIKREPEAGDAESYQTIFARHKGSVAAPTAGLHFTERLLETLGAKGVSTAKITLHVGPGTFKPIRTELVEDHKIRPEFFRVGLDVAVRIEAARAGGRRVAAVGTTAVRALESAASGGKVEAVSGLADLLIAPGYKFKAVDALLTNFHLPRSSLLALVAAFAGLEFTLEAYRRAVGNRYRFYSYGDAMLII